MNPQQLLQFVQVALKAPKDKYQKELSDALDASGVTQLKSQGMGAFLEALEISLDANPPLNLPQDDLMELAQRFPRLQKNTNILERIGEERRKKLGAALSTYPALASLLKR